VEGQGDFITLPGVARVEDDKNNRGAKVVYMDEATSSNDLLAAIAADASVSVNRFEMAIPSLNDIFIIVAGEDPREAAINGYPAKEQVHV